MINAIYIERKPKTVRLAAVIVGVLCLAIGFYLALQKPLWDDEIFSQIQSIEDLSYARILAGKIGEGNTCPLFYAIQKAVSQITEFHFPQERVPGTYVVDARSQVIMRVMPNVCMSAALVLIFYYFSRFYSWSAGFYSLLVSSSCFMVWVYWAEARPYALWVLLTAAQSLIFMYMIREREINRFAWHWLVAVNIMLSLTVVFGLAQVVIVSFLVWIFKERNFRRYVFLTGIPVALSFFYYFQAPKYLFQFFDSPLQLFLVNISPERIILVFVYSLLIIYYAVRQKAQNPLLYSEAEKKEGVSFLALSVLIFAATTVIMTIFKINELRGPEAFLINKRYFIYLTPVGIIATTLFSVHVVRAFRQNAWMLTNILICLGGLLIIRCIRTYMELFSTALYLRIPS